MPFYWSSSSARAPARRANGNISEAYRRARMDSTSFYKENTLGIIIFRFSRWGDPIEGIIIKKWLNIWILCNKILMLRWGMMSPPPHNYHEGGILRWSKERNCCKPCHRTQSFPMHWLPMNHLLYSQNGTRMHLWLQSIRFPLDILPQISTVLSS